MPVLHSNSKFPLNEQEATQNAEKGAAEAACSRGSPQFILKMVISEMEIFHWKPKEVRRHLHD